jgi:hypothetical protein
LQVSLSKGSQFLEDIFGSPINRAHNTASL